MWPSRTTAAFRFCCGRRKPTRSSPLHRFEACRLPLRREGERRTRQLPKLVIPAQIQSPARKATFCVRLVPASAWRESFSGMRSVTEGRLALRAKLSTENLSLILDACNGWTMDPEAPRHLWIQVADGMRLHELDTKWPVAILAGLIRRLQELTWLESLALADAIERFWRAKRKGQVRHPSQALE